MGAAVTHALIVDDDPIFRQVLAAFFASHGVGRVETAENAANGLALVQAETTIDLIVTDLHMPDADGIELLTGIAAARPDVAIVIISSASETLRRGAALLATAQRLDVKGVFAKPVSFPALAETLALIAPQGQNQPAA